MDVESLARDFLLYGSVQGSAAGSIQMKCLNDLDEAERLAAEAVQLKPILTLSSASAAGVASISGSTLPSLCECRFCTFGAPLLSSSLSL